jgi:glycosyltransferase involved in cell wall biosynthesis
MSVLNLFYDEPDPDRFVPFDRYPRRVLRRLVRGPKRPGGQTRVFLNLMAGLDRIGIRYRVNDYKYARRHPEEIACIIGKRCVLEAMEWKNPIVFGSAVSSHPFDDMDLLNHLSIKKILVPGEWMRRMCEPHYGEQVVAWPVGIDTEHWRPAPITVKDIDILIYDKVMWEYDRHLTTLINPLLAGLERRELKTARLRYGYYREEEFRALLARSKSMLFLCRHETQGIAYQQALSCNVPIFAWNRAGFWQDPEFYPERVRYQPVSSVPYWDARCGMTFADAAEFDNTFDGFWSNVRNGVFAPRDYILEHLTLEQCAKQYVKIVEQVQTNANMDAAS